MIARSQTGTTPARRASASSGPDNTGCSPRGERGSRGSCRSCCSPCSRLATAQFRSLTEALMVLVAVPFALGRQRLDVVPAGVPAVGAGLDRLAVGLSGSRCRRASSWSSTSTRLSTGASARAAACRTRHSPRTPKARCSGCGRTHHRRHGGESASTTLGGRRGRRGHAARRGAHARRPATSAFLTLEVSPSSTRSGGAGGSAGHRAGVQIASMLSARRGSSLPTNGHGTRAASGTIGAARARRRSTRRRRHRRSRA